MQRELGGDGRAHALQSVEKRHEQAERADAVAQDLDVPGAGCAADGVDSRRPVVLDDVVHGELLRRARQGRARPIVEQPHVVAGVAQMLDQVDLDRVERVRGGRDADAGRNDDRAPVTTLVTRQRQAHPVCRPNRDTVGFGAGRSRGGGLSAIRRLRWAFAAAG